MQCVALIVLGNCSPGPFGPRIVFTGQPRVTTPIHCIGSLGFRTIGEGWGLCCFWGKLGVGALVLRQPRSPCGWFPLSSRSSRLYSAPIGYRVLDSCSPL